MIVGATEHITITLSGGGIGWIVFGVCFLGCALAYGLVYFGKGR